MKKILNFIKSETVLSIAALLAVLSMFLVPPSAGYIEYIDLRTLGLLFSLMVIMAGLREMGVFARIGRGLAAKAGSVRKLTIVMVLLTFFSSMVITNDVALITFVPFAIEVFRLSGREDRLLPVVVYQTIAANLGSMLTPLGNPQNLYLYSLTGMGLGEFIGCLLPYTLLSLLLLMVIPMVSSDAPLAAIPAEKEAAPDKKKLICYLLLFILCLLTVLRLIPWQAVVGILLIVVLAADRKTLLKADYALLLMFVCFFIFVGNMGELPAVRELLTRIVEGREVVISILLSQVISNVPAALLLSGFTDELRGILIGVNLGGLGTLIASMASLISYKYIAAALPQKKGRYLVIFTGWNLAFLAVLTALWLLIG